MEYNFNLVPFGLQIISRRTPIQIVFPMFLLMVMWLMVCGQLLALLPYYLRIKKVDGWGFATAPGPLIFAMTAVRNTMPGAPPIGKSSCRPSYLSRRQHTTYDLPTLSYFLS